MAMAEIFDMNDKRTAEKQKALESAAALMMPPLLDTIRTPRLLSL